MPEFRIEEEEIDVDGEWDMEDSAAAMREGWDVFDSSDYGMQIERADELALFGSDDDAIQHVRSMASCGEQMHVKALRIHDTNPKRAEAKASEAMVFVKTIDLVPPVALPKISFDWADVMVKHGDDLARIFNGGADKFRSQYLSEPGYIRPPAIERIQIEAKIDWDKVLMPMMPPDGQIESKVDLKLEPMSLTYVEVDQGSPVRPQESSIAGLIGNTAALMITDDPMPATYKRGDVVDALAVWEAMLDERREANSQPEDTLKPWQRGLNSAWDDFGCGQMRLVAINLTQNFINPLWESLPESYRENMSYDWEFIPEALEHVLWLQLDGWVICPNPPMETIRDLMLEEGKKTGKIAASPSSTAAFSRCSHWPRRWRTSSIT